jgi:hypothetical protein
VSDEPENGEELIDDEGRNQTQQSIDEERENGWGETNDDPAQGEEGQEIV